LQEFPPWTYSFLDFVVCQLMLQASFRFSRTAVSTSSNGTPLPKKGQKVRRCGSDSYPAVDYLLNGLPGKSRWVTRQTGGARRSHISHDRVRQEIVPIASRICTRRRGLGRVASREWRHNVVVPRDRTAETRVHQPCSDELRNGSVITTRRKNIGSLTGADGSQVSYRG
jgi:hypothetical protein